MKHPSEEQLIAYQDGEASGREALAAHLRECIECRAEVERIAQMLAGYRALPAPDPGEGFGRRVWQQIAPRLEEKHGHWWDLFLEPRRLLLGALVAVLLLVAFQAGRITKHPVTGESGGGTTTTADARVRERVLMLAVGEHLGRSEMVLMEIANAEPQGAGLKQVSLKTQQRRAEDLLEENRLYRQTALQEGDTGLADVLDELERVLMDVAHSPQSVSAAQFKTIRQRIDDDGLLFKVRVLAKQIQQRESSRKPGSTQSGAAQMERNNQA